LILEIFNIFEKVVTRIFKNWVKKNKNNKIINKFSIFVFFLSFYLFLFNEKYQPKKTKLLIKLPKKTGQTPE
jgi:hypothetical protein